MSLIRLHIKYLFNKINIAIFLVLLAFLFLFHLITSNAFSGFDVRYFNRESYLISYNETLFSVLKIIMPVFSIFIFGNSFTDSFDNYNLLIIRKRSERIKFFLTKEIAIIIFNIAIFLIAFIIYFTFGSLFVVGFTPFIYPWISISVVALAYGNICVFIINIIKHNFGILLVIITYIIITAISDLWDYETSLINIIIPLFSNQLKLLPINALALLNYLYLGSFSYYKKSM